MDRLSDSLKKPGEHPRIRRADLPDYNTKSFLLVRTRASWIHIKIASSPADWALKISVWNAAVWTSNTFVTKLWTRFVQKCEYKWWVFEHPDTLQKVKCSLCRFAVFASRWPAEDPDSRLLRRCKGSVHLKLRPRKFRSRKFRLLKAGTLRPRKLGPGCLDIESLNLSIWTSKDPAAYTPKALQPLSLDLETVYRARKSSRNSRPGNVNLCEWVEKLPKTIR